MSLTSETFGAVESPAVVAPVLTTATPDQIRRRGEVLVALGRRAIAAPSWRTLAHDAAALVAETLGTDLFAIAELSDDRSTLTVRIANVGQSRKEGEAPAHLVPCAATNSLSGFALSVAQPVSV